MTPTLNTVKSPYRGLSYTGINYEAPGLVPGVVPQSAPNLAGTGLINQVTNPNRGISVNGTTTKSFDLIELYYGCLFSTRVTIFQIATPCKFIVTGYRNSGTVKVGPASFEFAPSSRTKASMNLGKFSAAFANLEEIRFEPIFTDPLTPNYVIVFDDIKYKLYPK